MRGQHQKYPIVAFYFLASDDIFLSTHAIQMAISWLVNPYISPCSAISGIVDLNAQIPLLENRPRNGERGRRKISAFLVFNLKNIKDPSIFPWGHLRNSPSSGLRN